MMNYYSTIKTHNKGYLLQAVKQDKKGKSVTFRELVINSFSEINHSGLFFFPKDLRLKIELHQLLFKNIDIPTSDQQAAIRLVAKYPDFATDFLFAYHFWSAAGKFYVLALGLKIETILPFLPLLHHGFQFRFFVPKSSISRNSPVLAACKIHDLRLLVLFNQGAPLGWRVFAEKKTRTRGPAAAHRLR